MRLLPKSLVHHETGASKNAQHDDGWDPQFIDLAFIAWLQCDAPSCKQLVGSAGIGGMEPEWEPEDGSFAYQERFYPRYLWPMPDVIDIPLKCPKAVVEQLKCAFALIWQDPGSSGNKVRVSLERLMDHFGVQTKAKNTNGTFSVLSLHQRLEIFGKKNDLIRDQLMAVKWLGNTGSHEGDITQSDLLDALAIIEHLLAELIDERTTKVALLAKKLTRKHRPTKRKKRA